MQGACENALLIGILRQFRCSGQGRGMTGLLAQQLTVQFGMVLAEVISGISTGCRGRKALQQRQPELLLLLLQPQRTCR